MISIFAVAQLFLCQAEALAPPSPEYEVCLNQTKICLENLSEEIRPFENGHKGIILGVKTNLISAQHPLPFLSRELNLRVPASQ